MPRRILDLFGPDVAGRFKLLGAAVVAALALVALAVTLVYRINVTQQIRGQSVQQCRQIEALKDAISSVLRDGRANVVARHHKLSPAQYQYALSYYDRQLDRFRPKEC
jgi:uncharacterized protein YcfL